RSQEQAIRRVMIDLVEETSAERDFESFVESVVEGRLSSAIYGEAKTIYPLRRVEVKKLTLEARPEEVAAEEETAVDVDESDVAVEESD
ncbi:MAG: 30S ribosomal protein S3ae, partial [Haloferacaceae archaeon]